MNTLMVKYLDAYRKAKGNETAKIKNILMYYAHSWDWYASDSLIADLIDDQNITADDIVEFLSNVYSTEGGNAEFRCAIRAMQVCLQKSKLQDAKPASNKAEFFEDNSNEDEVDGSGYLPNVNDFLKHQPLSH